MTSGFEGASLHERHVGSYAISDDSARLDLRAIHAYLTRSYWSPGIPFGVVERAVRASLCIGAYDRDGAQIGLVRLVSDYATFCYVCDVYVLEDHRGQGLSKAMLGMAIDHPRLQDLRHWSLVTSDAHGLYRQFGFTPIARPERQMERRDPDVYRRLAGGKL
ncbi:MAG: GNAT family N-acetyltransferase [Gammaproteobacteria bacterium]|nr:GNAT family N-acetyltransferase [Gammaproteobacteria bacterium]